MMQTRFFPARFEYLDEIREFVGAIARQGGFNDKEVYAIQLAADEAASNIIEHAYEDSTEGRLECSCGIEESDLVIKLHDDGKPFDPSRVRKPDLKADLSRRQIGGLGVYLMRKLMDDVRYESIPGKGNLLTMKKRKG